jgi:hypothetical protein
VHAHKGDEPADHGCAENGQPQGKAEAKPIDGTATCRRNTTRLVVDVVPGQRIGGYQGLCRRSLQASCHGAWRAQERRPSASARRGRRARRRTRAPACRAPRTAAPTGRTAG